MIYLWTAVSWSAAWDSSTVWSLPSGKSRFGASAILVLCYCLRISSPFWSRLKWQLFSYTQQLFSGLPGHVVIILWLIVSTALFVKCLNYQQMKFDMQIFKVCREWILLPWSAADFSSNTTPRITFLYEVPCCLLDGLSLYYVKSFMFPSWWAVIALVL